MNENVFLIYFLGGHSTFFAMLNSFVHIVMYFYYMVAAMGPKYQKFIWWKKYLTTFQMVCDFCFFLLPFYILPKTYKMRKIFKKFFNFFRFNLWPFLHINSNYSLENVIIRKDLWYGLVCTESCSCSCFPIFTNRNTPHWKIKPKKLYKVKMVATTVHVWWVLSQWFLGKIIHPNHFHDVKTFNDFSCIT